MAALKNARQTCKDINNLLDKIRLHFSEWELTLENKPTTEDIKKELKKALSKKLPTKVIPAKVARVGFFDRLDIINSLVPTQVVMKWTGHSDYRAMKPYRDIAEKTKADAMKTFEEAMSK